MTTATPNTTTPNAAAPVATPAKKPSTRLAQKMMPDVDPNSALLPPDKWILQTMWNTLKTHKGIRRTVIKMAGFSLLAVGAVAGGITGAVLAPALIPALAVGAAALAVTAGSGVMVKKLGEKLKTDFMPDLMEIVKTKYLELKMNEMKEAWRKRAAQKKQERAAQKAADAVKAEQAAKAAQEAKIAEEAEAARIAAEKPATKKPETTKPKAQETKTPQEGPKGFAKNFLRKAMKKAQDFGEEVQDEIKKQRAGKQVRNDNAPKNNADKKSAPPQP